MEDMLEVEGRSFALEYLAEGASNVVYKLRPYQPSLLRLRKTRSTIAYDEIVRNFNTVVAPLFLNFPNDALIHPIPFKLPNPGSLLPTLNKALHLREATGRRGDKRQGVYLATDEEYGIFVHDMTPRHEKERFMEFKPKWLIQSPSAPTNARRCRTCALREMRRADGVPSGRGDSGFCPLDLLSTEDDVLEHVLTSLVGDDMELVKAIFKQTVQPLLHHLRTLQIEHNRVGLTDLDSSDISTAFHVQVDRRKETSAASPLLDTLLGMTVRDCSVFIRYVPGGSQNEAEVKLADLDMKSAKLEKWANIEKQLIDGGWYTGTEALTRNGGRFCRALQRR